MSVDHQAYLRADGLPHSLHGFQVLLGSEGGPHFVGAEPHRGDSRGFLSEAARRHVHASATVELDSIAFASANNLRQRNSFEAGGKIGEGDFDGAVGSRSEEHTSELQSQSNLVCRLL